MWGPFSSPGQAVAELEEMPSSCARGGSDWTLEEFFQCKDDEVLEEIAQGDGVVTIPDSVQGTTSHATLCYGLVDVVVLKG